MGRTVPRRNFSEPNQFDEPETPKSSGLRTRPTYGEREDKRFKGMPCTFSLPFGSVRVRFGFGFGFGSCLLHRRIGHSVLVRFVRFKSRVLFEFGSVSKNGFVPSLYHTYSSFPYTLWTEMSSKLHACTVDCLMCHDCLGMILKCGQ